MTLSAAIASVMAAASGLHHVHQHGVLHRDVKPENLMFDGGGTLKVTDFGIARQDTVQASAVGLTRAGEFFGTPAYIAPEQAAPTFGGGWPPVGPAADQYTLAAVLYELPVGPVHPRPDRRLDPSVHAAPERRGDAVTVVGPGAGRARRDRRDARAATRSVGAP